MRSILFTAAFLFCATLSFAQNTSAQTKKPPCLSPSLELYDDKDVKLPEGSLPSGKITLKPKKNPACPEGIKYEVQAVDISMVRGFIRMEHTTVGGNMVDLAGMKSKLVPGDRLVFMLLANYASEKGKTGDTTFFFNWPIKQAPQ